MSNAPVVPGHFDVIQRITVPGQFDRFNRNPAERLAHRMVAIRRDAHGRSSLSLR